MTNFILGYLCGLLSAGIGVVWVALVFAKTSQKEQRDIATWNNATDSTDQPKKAKTMWER